MIIYYSSYLKSLNKFWNEMLTHRDKQFSSREVSFIIQLPSFFQFWVLPKIRRPAKTCCCLKRKQHNHTQPSFLVPCVGRHTHTQTEASNGVFFLPTDSSLNLSFNHFNKHKSIAIINKQRVISQDTSDNHSRKTAFRTRVEFLSC